MHLHLHPCMNDDLIVQQIYIYIYIYLSHCTHYFSDGQCANVIRLRHKFWIKWMDKIYIKEYKKFTKLYLVASAFGINLFIYLFNWLKYDKLYLYFENVSKNKVLKNCT